MQIHKPIQFMHHLNVLDIIILPPAIWFSSRQGMFLPSFPKDLVTKIFSRLTFSVTYPRLAVIIKDGGKQWQDESKSQQVDEECQEDNCNNTITVLFLLVIDGAAANFSLLQGHVPRCSASKKLHLYPVNRKHSAGLS